MNKKDKFFMLLALSCLPLSEMAAEQVDGMAVSPITQEVLQNSVKITGKVVDVQGEPVIGATVMEKGTTNGIITDVDGNFTLNVSPNRKLQVSYVGYQTQEITIGSNRTLRITLKEDSELLDEVVVVGYGTMKKSDLTGAVSSVSTQDLMRSGRTDAVGAMQGALPGVQIQRSNNKPGGEMSGGVRNVSVSNCQFLGTDVGLRFKSKRGRGGVVENIWIRNIAMMDIPTEPITFNLYYGGKSAVEVLESGEKVPAKVEPLPVDETTPCFRNIHVKNLVCAGARRALFFNGIPEMPIDGIVLEDIDITSKLGAEFIYSKNISMKNVNIRNTEGEKIVTRYCEGVEE